MICCVMELLILKIRHMNNGGLKLQYKVLIDRSEIGKVSLHSLTLHMTGSIHVLNCNAQNECGIRIQLPVHSHSIT
jgi:flavin reductase (DIM6/NTAB) family NADH-FMN oxidoreductase RutF